MASAVSLLIKAPTGNIDDLIINSATLDWTVQQVKAAITAMHPAHPSALEQRLIYAGRLMLDHLKLREVVLQFDPGHPLVLHLIVSEPALTRSMSLPATPASARESPNPTLRHRPHFSPATPATPAPSAAPSGHFSSPSGHMPAGTPGSPGGPAYAPYHPYYGSGGGYPTMYSPEQYQRALQMQMHAQAAAAQYYAHHYPGMASMAANVPLGGANGHFFVPSPAPYAAADTAAADVPGPGAEDQVGPDAAPDLEPHRFAQAGVGAAAMVDDGGEDGPNRNPALGMMALALKLSFMVYLFGQHATRVRFTILCLIAVVIFVWQSGIFRRRRRPAAIPAPRAPPAADPAAALPPDTAAAPIPVPVPASLTRLLGEVVWTFFASLVPQRNPEAAGAQ